MTNILKLLANGEQITEWIDPWDERLVTATGQPAPNTGGSLREDWRFPLFAGGIAALLVRRCLVPAQGDDIKAIFRNTTNEYMPRDKGTIILKFACRDDLSSWFPTNDKTKIWDDEDFGRAWAAVGAFGRLFGLAVFSCEQPSSGIEARIQPVPQAMFERIITAE